MPRSVTKHKANGVKTRASKIIDTFETYQHPQEALEERDW
jgi:hypothetical protein